IGEIGDGHRSSFPTAPHAVFRLRGLAPTYEHGAMHVNGSRMTSLLGRFGVLIALALLIGGATLAGTAHAKPLTEKEKIDALLQVVESRNDLQFIRLGE